MSTLPAQYSKEVNEKIAVNQVAYGVNDKKLAIINGQDIEKSVVENDVYLVDAKSGESVFSAKLSGPYHDETNEIDVYYFDFSEVTAQGEYFVAAENGVSFTFRISASPIKEISYAILKMLYFQRCGCGLDKKYAGKYAHDKCHNVTAYYALDTRLKFEDMTGGWHDAGDYGRYITPANQCIFNLMYAHELFGKGVDDDINIPETGSGMPDILSEAEHELKWMLKMQTPQGGVYHKICTTEFAGNDMPENDHRPNNEMIVSQISLQATAGFAASMAAAYRTYLPYDKDFAEKMLSASKNAFKFAVDNQDKIMTEFKNIYPGGGGGYGDWCYYDELYWAAAELFRSTGDEKYEEHFKQFFEKDFPKTDCGAYCQGGYGSIAYLLTENADPEFKAKIHDIMVEHADKMLEISQKDAYKVSLPKDGYFWGSNAALFNSLTCVVALSVIDNTDKYDDCLKDNCAYLFGRNIISQSYVTGFGSKKPMHPHHRPSMFDNVDEPVPGMVIGGPNDRPGQRPDNSEGAPSAACYIDWEWNWTTNEVTIYWNTAALFVTGYLASKE